MNEHISRFYRRQRHRIRNLWWEVVVCCRYYWRVIWDSLR
jgi:hypothetical protein